MKELIAFFSRADENYVSGELKFLKVGNTELVADLIQSLTGAEQFKIEPVQPYSKNYNECIAQVHADQYRNARPELKYYPCTLECYDTIYLGYPKMEYGFLCV